MTASSTNLLTTKGCFSEISVSVRRDIETLSSSLGNHESFRNNFEDGLHKLQIGIDSIADIAAKERQGRPLTKPSFYCEKS